MIRQIKSKTTNMFSAVLQHTDFWFTTQINLPELVYLVLSLQLPLSHPYFYHGSLRSFSGIYWFSVIMRLLAECQSINWHNPFWVICSPSPEFSFQPLNQVVLHIKAWCMHLLSFVVSQVPTGNTNKEWPVICHQIRGYTIIIQHTIRY